MPRTVIMTMGYQTRKVADIELVVANTGALLVDIRFAANSPNPMWRRAAFEERFGDNYLAVREYGNRDYRGTGVNLADPDAAATTLLPILQQRSVILMCGPPVAQGSQEDLTKPPGCAII
jgi:hypothetical protein